MRDVWGYIFGGTDRYPNKYRWMETAAIIVFAAMTIGLSVRIGHGLSQGGGGSPWLVVPAFMSGYLAADFASGFVHWMADTFGTEQTWFFGPKFVKNFREHHVDPKGITRHDFVETNGDNCMVCLPWFVGACFFPIETTRWGNALAIYVVAWMQFVLLTNQLHKWAHSDVPPRFVRPLQRLGLVLSPEHHDVHHRSPHEKNYCITSGWLNPILDGIGFFRGMERLVVTTTKACSYPIEVQRGREPEKLALPSRLRSGKRAAPRMAAAPRDPDERSLFDRVLVTLAMLQLRRPWAVLGACFGLSLAMAGLATRLTLKTEFAELLPDGQPSVIELRRVLARTTGIAQVFVVLEGDDPAALRELGDRIVPKLVAVGPPWVGSAEDGVQVARTYLMSRAGLFADKQKLEKLREDLDARWDWEVSKQMGQNLDDEAPPAITRQSFETAFDGSRRGEVDRFPGGYFQSKDGRALVVVARAAVPAGDLGGSREALARIRAVVEKEHGGAASIRVSYAGDLVTSLLSYGAIKDDLVDVGVLGIGLVLGVILLFYMRIRTLVALGVTIAAGVAWTFGLTQATIGHLNVATGFLFSIVAGNGINFGIIYQARYLEERRSGASVDDAVITAHRTTWGATITAALAAAASYGSLAVTDFRGFRHFAVIGAGGMVLCFLATYTLLPAVLVVIERLRPSAGNTAPTTWWGRLRANGLAFGTPFAAIVAPMPRVLAASGVALAIAGVLGGVKWLRADPLEYDMRRLENDFGGGPGVLRTSALAREILGVSNESAMVVLCDRVDQVRPLVRELEARRDAAPPGEKPFEAVHTLLDFVPEGQEAKVPALVAIRNRLMKARGRGFVSDADWKDIAEMLPPDDLRPIRVEDLPTELARAFSERDGTRGRLVYIEPTAGKDDNDLRYLLRWADSFRETKLPDGSVVRGSGRAVIFADMLRAVLVDMPKAVVASLLLTAIAVAVVFRRGKSTALVIGALAIGVAWLAGLVFLLGVKLNFLNFIALPITFGIGVDYAVNLVHRQSNGASALESLRTTGGAIVLCSLTTTLGYLALLRSLNQGVRSLGLIAVLGEVCCLLAAMVVLPAALRWSELRRKP